MNYTVINSKKADKDLIALRSQKALYKRVFDLLKIIKKNPYQNPPRYEKLSGDLESKYSRRLNKKHRIVYEVNEKTKEVYILSLLSHYEF